MLSKSYQSLDPSETWQYFNKVKWDKEDLEHAKKYINKLSFLSDLLKYDIKGFDELGYILSNNEKILVPTFGQYSSGKSSLLNVLIGKEYLPSSEGICTNRGAIIEYSPNDDFSELWEIKLKFETMYSKFFSFEKKKIIISSNDSEKIKEEIDKINKEHKPIKFEDSFLLLKVHINLFELLEEENREKILLIDFPGLGVLRNGNYFKSDVLGPLINQSDSFLFINPELINSDDNQKIINKIIEKIRNRKISFSYNNCLFIMNKWDLHRENESNYTLNDAKNDLKAIFSNNSLDYIFPDIDIINFSSQDYKAYLAIKENVLDFDKYFKNLMKDFEEEYNEFEEEGNNQNKSELFYEYIMKQMSFIINDIIDISKVNIAGNEIIDKLNNFLAETEYELPDNYKNEIAKNYLNIIHNINKHKYLLESNKNKLEEKIILHLKSSLIIMRNIIKVKGINFLLNINDTIRFILENLDNNLQTNQKYKKIDEVKKIKEEIINKFKKQKELIDNAFEKNKKEQELMINKYIEEVDGLFVNRKRNNMDLENRKVLGQIEQETLNKLKENKNIFYQELEGQFNKFIDEIKDKVSDIKYNLNIKNNFNQEYFETSEVGSNVVAKSFKSNFFGLIKSITDFLNIKSWSEYLLHKYILLDDKDTIINKSIENFNLVKIQNQENLDDYKRVYQEKIEDFETLVNANVQKMIDLSYSDYSQFKNEKRKIIEESTYEFNEFIRNKYKNN